MLKIVKNLKEIKVESKKIINDKIYINENILVSHNTRIYFTCEVCGNNTSKFYTKQTEKMFKSNHLLCRKCFTKKTLFEKYGVNNVSQIKDVSNKRKKTFIEKYGVENPSQLDGVKNKKIETHRKNFGTDYPSQSSNFWNKYEKKHKQKYGETHYFKTEEFKNKSKETMVELYGVTSILKDEQKKKNGMMKKYGVTNAMKCFELKSKAIRTNLEKYNVRNQFQRYYFIQSRINLNYHKFYTLISDYATPLFLSDEYNGVNGSYWFLCKCCNAEYYATPHNNSNNIPKCPHCFPAPISKPQQELFDFILLYFNDVVQNDKSVLNKHEIDVYIPSLNIGVEFNGLYWHSTKFKNKNYHLNKTIECESKGAKLIHIFEDDWNNNKKEVKQYLLNYFNKKTNEYKKGKRLITDISKPIHIKNKFIVEKNIPPQIHCKLNEEFEVYNCGYQEILIV